ncbi:NADH-quinone oxidoreductase subunit L [Thermostilla marina]
MEFLLILVPMMPLAAALATALLGKHVLRSQSHVPAVTAIAISFAAALILCVWTAGGDHAAQEIGTRHIVRLWTWADVPSAAPSAPDGSLNHANFDIGITLRLDPLTAIMLVTVTFISLLVAVYSIGYMHDDPGYWRFFTYINLFVFSMTMLVSVSNFLLLYVFWEAVGLCSYLLIGFWFQKPEAAAAGKKAFLVNRVGDFGFAIGIFLLWTMYGTLNFHDVVDPQTGEVIIAGVLGGHRLASGAFVTGGIATATCLLLFLGACGKSAQFPLHVWLPDAMEGPTPVSALIHAATMVTAGVYMIVRCAPLFAASPQALEVVAGIGAFTALLAALIALTQTDLKRVLAYSTISQLGYMFLGLGVGGIVGGTAAMFHLFTHAFFKALLFLGAGSVMHAMGGVIDMTRFGGLRKRMPWTHITFLAGCLALAGLFPFAGFFSKDRILAAVQAHAAEHEFYTILYYTGVVTAFLTAFYTFRAFFLTFYGPEQIPEAAGHHAHESPLNMVVPLGILAVCAIVVGAIFNWGDIFGRFLANTPSLAYFAEHASGHGGEHHGDHLLVAIQSTIAAAAGIGLAALFYLPKRSPLGAVAAVTRKLGLYDLSKNKFYFDELYMILLVLPMWGIAYLAAFFDRRLIDRLVDAVGETPKAVGTSLRSLQRGLVPYYAAAMLLGVLVLTIALLL